MSNSVIIAVRIKDELKKELMDYAEENDLDVSKVVRKSIKKFIKKKKR